MNNYRLVRLYPNDRTNPTEEAEEEEAAVAVEDSGAVVVEAEGSAEAGSGAEVATEGGDTTLRPINLI